MKALFCENRLLSLRDIEKPRRHPDEVLIRVKSAGICSTDLEIIKGYIPGFSGVMGHEFFGRIEEADDPAIVGKRATAEINCACGSCGFCRSGLGRHCPHRTVLGITGKQGAFAGYISVPATNVVLVPDEIPDTAAVLIEPLAAALEIFDQLSISEEHAILLIGDGRLAQMIATVFFCKEYPLTVVGKHAGKLAFLNARGATTFLRDGFSPAGAKFDIVIEASGSPGGFDLGLACVKPRGTLVLKSTYAGGFQFNPALIVVNEISIIGSRCGRFDEALRFLLNYRPDLSYMISGRFPFSQALRAFERMQDPETLKVIMDMEDQRL